MLIDKDDIAGAAVVRPHGRVDSVTSAALEQAVLGEGPTAKLLDLSDVPYMSSAGLRVVLQATKAARATGGRFVLFGLSPVLRQVFHVSGFDRIVVIAETEAEALATATG